MLKSFRVSRFCRKVIMFEIISDTENAYIFGILRELNAICDSTMEMSSFARSQ